MKASQPAAPSHPSLFCCFFQVDLGPKMETAMILHLDWSHSLLLPFFQSSMQKNLNNKEASKEHLNVAGHYGDD